MFIQTETTPNPSTLKFLPGREVVKGGTANFNHVADAEKKSPLAVELLQLKHVCGVFFGSDFISITKSDSVEWSDLKPTILGTLLDYFSSEKPIIMDGATLEHKSSKKVHSKDTDPIVEKIKELLETRVRPAVAQDGGDIIFHEYDDGIVYLSMLGACGGCPSSTMTLKMGIENMLKYYIPEVVEVRPVN